MVIKLHARKNFYKVDHADAGSVCGSEPYYLVCPRVLKARA